MQPVFNFSSASHSLLSVFRALSGAHGAAIAAKSKEAVAEQLALLLPQAQQLGAVCVPTLPADVRDPYAKQVLVVQGLVALTSAVARNVTAMLQQVRRLDTAVRSNSWQWSAQTSSPWQKSLAADSGRLQSASFLCVA